MPKRRVTIRKTEGQGDRDHALLERGREQGRAEAEEEHKEGLKSARASARQDERTKQMKQIRALEREIEGLKQQLAEAKKQPESYTVRKNPDSPWHALEQNDEWIAPFEEDDNKVGEIAPSRTRNGYEIGPRREPNAKSVRDILRSRRAGG